MDGGEWGGGYFFSSNTYIVSMVRGMKANGQCGIAIFLPMTHKVSVIIMSKWIGRNCIANES